MYVYQSFEPNLFTVGFYTPDGRWVTENDYELGEFAAQRVAWLNGSSIQEFSPVLPHIFKPT